MKGLKIMCPTLMSEENGVLNSSTTQESKQHWQRKAGELKAAKRAA